MLKISWAVKSDRFAHYFAICDYKSAWQLWWSLLAHERDDGSKPINIRVTGLDGQEVDVNSRDGIHEWIRAAEMTRGTR